MTTNQEESGYCFSRDERRQPQWVLRLNKYQRDNLLWLINICYKVDPFTIANNGDWIGEILWMISSSGELEEGDVPNCTMEELKKRIEWWKALGYKGFEEKEF